VSGPRPLGELIAVLETRDLLRAVVPGGGRAPAATPVAGVELDSRRVRPGAVFVAVPGARADGHDYAAAAVAAGAPAVVVERTVPGLGVPQLVVVGSRRALATASAWVAGFPSCRLGVVGITGTDGKTTTGFLVRAVLEAAGLPCGIVGTVAALAGGQALHGFAHQTTPEAPELQEDLAAMVAAGDRFAVVEATSHGLALERVAEVAFDVAVLTNVTHEHLEFHRTHEAYRAAKRRLFQALVVGEANPEKDWGKTGVVNLDDRWAGEFTEATRGAGARLLGYGSGAGADVRLTGLTQDSRGLRMAVATPRWSGEVSLPLLGRFNATNALAAVAVGEALSLDPAAVRAGLESAAGVPGRMERVASDAPFDVIVDYAHTPRSLELVLDDLASAAAAGGGGIVAVFGSAGERDVMKRAVMGRIAGERCRAVVLTDEDPRGEDSLAILDDIAQGAEAAGLRRGVDLLLVPDRTVAVAAALGMARAGDVVLLAGKGHERTIEMAAGPRPWDERAVAISALADLGWHAG
jgi:UDP-N-acetylmuramoyl-L-alanyl-D-glutamate--2,6-diaminopimelate ligase